MTPLVAGAHFVLAAVTSGVLIIPILYGLRRGNVIDRPNARSLHAVAVPRGGGLAVVVVVIIAHVYEMVRAGGPGAG